MIGRFGRWGIVLLLLLAGCNLEGGALNPSPEASQPAATLSPSIPQSIEINRWTFGITEEPSNFYPYSTNSRAIQPLIELLYPAPLIVVDEIYTTTGVLERVPSFENGDVAYVTTTVFLDPLGVITTTQTEAISSVQQLTVTYHWNKTLRWADGTPLTADDSVFAYELYKQTSLPAQFAAQRDLTFDYVALDDFTTRAYLPPTRIDPNYLLTVWRPLPKHLFTPEATAQEVSEQLAREPLAYGPYTLQEWKPSFQIDFIRTPNAPPTFPDEIKVQIYPDIATLRQALDSKTIDIGWTEQLLDGQMEDFQAAVEAGTLQSWLDPVPVWEHIDFNLAVPALQDIRMRQAIAHGFNRAAASQRLYGSDSAVWDSWIAPSSWAYNQDITRYAFDPALAKSLLDAMGYLDVDGDGLRESPTSEPFSLTLHTSEQTPVRRMLADSFVADMQAIGLAITIKDLPTTELYSQQGPLFRREFQIALFGWLHDFDPDGAVLWSCAAIPNEINGFTGDNFTGWCMDTADAAIRTGNGAQSRAERRAAYLEHQTIFSRELPVVPILSRQMLVLAQPNVQGLRPQPFVPITWNLEQWEHQ